MSRPRIRLCTNSHLVLDDIVTTRRRCGAEVESRADAVERVAQLNEYVFPGQFCRACEAVSVVDGRCDRCA